MTPAVAAITPRSAAAERVRREQARRGLEQFAEYLLPWYRLAAHHRQAARLLEQVERYIATRGAEGAGRLLIFMPPRHGKTELASKLFPAWLLGRRPDSRVILASYGGDLAAANSRTVRNYVTSDRYAAVFGPRSALETPVTLSEDSRSAGAWDLAAPHRGGLVASGVGGGITGRGAHLLVLDDPVKNREEAESAAERERLWDWWRSTAYTRLEDGGAVVGMLTRWHADDWAGRILRAMASDPLADQYEVLHLPAVAEFSEGDHRDGLLDGQWVEAADPLGREAGEPLWPQKYGLDDLAKIQANIGSYDWAALYQQRPYLRQGGMFRRDWFHLVTALPKKIASRVRYWDKAGTEGGGAYTAGVLLALGEDDHVYVEHVVRGQWSAYEREQTILRTAQEDAKRPGPGAVIWHEQEPGSGGKDSAQATNWMLAKAGFSAHFEAATGDKAVRAQPFASACEAGRVHLLQAGWNAAYIEEHVSFPAGRYKDQVDAGSGAYVKLSQRKRESRIL